MSRLTYVYGKLPAQDVQRARRFYQETLGLSPFAEHNNHLYYEAAGVRFLIFPSVGAYSGANGPPVPEQMGRAFRSKWATRSGEMGHPLTG